MDPSLGIRQAHLIARWRGRDRAGRHGHERKRPARVGARGTRGRRGALSVRTAGERRETPARPWVGWERRSPSSQGRTAAAGHPARPAARLATRAGPSRRPHAGAWDAWPRLEPPPEPDPRRPLRCEGEKQKRYPPPHRRPTGSLRRGGRLTDMVASVKAVVCARTAARERTMAGPLGTRLCASIACGRIRQARKSSSPRRPRRDRLDRDQRCTWAGGPGHRRLGFHSVNS